MNINKHSIILISILYIIFVELNIFMYWTEIVFSQLYFSQKWKQVWRTLRVIHIYLENLILIFRECMNVKINYSFDLSQIRNIIIWIILKGNL